MGALNIDTKEQEMIRQYLLGQAPDRDLSRLEERLLTDAAFYEELLTVEDELVDQYVGGRLSDSERESFGNHFALSRERQKKVRFAKALNKYLTLTEAKQLGEEPALEAVSQKVAGIATVPSPAVATAPSRDAAKVLQKKPFLSFLPIRNPIVSYSLAAAAVLVIFAFSWIALENVRTPQHEPGKILAVALEPGLTRDSGEIRKFSIPPNSETVRMQLALPGSQYQSYEAVLQAVDGRIVTTKKDLQAQSASGGQLTMLVDVAASLLPPGDYRIKLNGFTNGNVESVGSYPFRVLSR